MTPGKPTAALTPNPGFDWSRVTWRAPRARVADRCSYCGAQIHYDAIPLMMWTENGWCARFCSACMWKWWNLAPFADGAAD